jgi:hypothetical protein
MNDERIARVLLTHEIAEFLYREAELLDERRYEECWVACRHIRYWMPMRRNVRFGEGEREFTRGPPTPGSTRARIRDPAGAPDPDRHPLGRGAAIAHRALCRTSSWSGHALGRRPAEVAVKCRFLVYRNRVETETDLLVGKREDLLRRGWG